MITFSKRFKSSLSHCKAFTLAETMVSVTILAIVLGSIIPTFIFFTKSITGLGNYTIMSGESRSALEVFGRDLHVAIDVRKATTDELTLVLPADLDSVRINYKYETITDSNGKISRVVSRSKFNDSSGTLLSKDILFEDVDSFKLVYYNRLSVDVSNSASILAEAKSVQINAKLLKKVITSNTTDYIISARFLMRNYN